MLQVNGCASGLTMYCSRILRMVHNYFTGGTYQFLMIAEHMLTLPTSALITLHCVLKKRCLEIFETTFEVLSARFRRGLYVRRLRSSSHRSRRGGAGQRGRAGCRRAGGAGRRGPAAGLREASGEGGVRGGAGGERGEGAPAHAPDICQRSNAIRKLD